MLQRNENWTIRKVCTDKDADALARLRYEIWVAGRGQWTDIADHEKKILWEDFDKIGDNYIATNEDEVIGSIRINNFRSMVPTICLKGYDILEYCGDFCDRGSVVTRAYIDPGWRCSTLFINIVSTMVQDALVDKLDLFFIHTAGARISGTEEDYIRMYQAMGFEIFRQTTVVPGGGAGSVLVFDLRRQQSGYNIQSSVGIIGTS